MIFEFDDFGCNHEISSMCQSHDCRDALSVLKGVNPDFKVTLFSIPGEMTQELLDWSEFNKDWVELGIHGFYHSSNYECEKMDYKTFGDFMHQFDYMFKYFAPVFRAPGWQISTEAMQWLKDHGLIIADQSYNDERRPEGLKAYVNYNGNFTVYDGVNPYGVEAWHGHVWNCVGNGIYETIDHLKELVARTTEFKTVSELFA